MSVGSTSSAIVLPLSVLTKICIVAVAASPDGSLEPDVARAAPDGG